MHIEYALFQKYSEIITAYLEYIHKRYHSSEFEHNVPLSSAIYINRVQKVCLCLFCSFSYE